MRKSTSILFCASMLYSLLFISGCDSKDASYYLKKGNDWTSRGDFKTGAKYYIKAAELGNPVAQYKLAISYETSALGTPKDIKKTLKWLMESAKQGYAPAENWLGGIYLRGQTLKRDPKEAHKWLLKAAEHGLCRAQRTLGEMYFYGNGIRKDENKALKWFMKAAKQNDPESKFYIGQIFAKRGKCLKALEFYKKSALQGNPFALVCLADMYSQGKGVEKNIKKAKDFYKRIKRLDANEAIIAYFYIKTGKPDEALEEWKKAMKSTKREYFMGTCKKKLDELEESFISNSSQAGNG